MGFTKSARQAAGSPDDAIMWPWWQRRRGKKEQPLPGFGHDDQNDLTEYDGAELADAPAVTAALARAPATFLGIAYDPPGDELTFRRDELPGLVAMLTKDGSTWELSIDDEVKGIADTGGYFDTENDVIEQTLASQPSVVESVHLDREIYWLRLARPEPPEAVLARFIDAIVTAHRDLARRLDIELPP